MILTAIVFITLGTLIGAWQYRYQPFESTNARLRKVVREYDLQYPNSNEKSNKIPTIND